LEELVQCLSFINEESIREFPEWTVEKVAGKAGISTRHISAKGQDLSIGF
jgi:3-oxoacyl-[acyl-carrier-protein] synthase-3